ncbi:MAG: tetratricopeptide repeat protein [Acidobacteriia bacterium]|nr:tetratricopeptide repeat protein [Terriglobia bacterium]
MKRATLVNSLFVLAAFAAPALCEENASARYRSIEAAHLTADERIRAYENLVKSAPGDPKVESRLASAFIQKLRETADFAYLNRASLLVEKMLASDPRSYDAIRLSAEIETHRHNFPKAAELAAELAARNPSDSGVFGILGDSLMELGRYDEADRAYQRMLTLSPNLAGYNRIAYQRFVTGQTGQALGWMAMAVEAGSPIPENLAWCLVEFGDMLSKTGHIEDAHKAYARALEILPGYHRALAASGREYAAAGEFAKAVEQFKKAQAVIPLPDYAAALATLYKALGKTPEAGEQMKLLEVIDRLGRANGEKGNRMLAVAYADENRNLDRALELARGELDTRKDVYTYDALSWVLFRSGNQKEAEEASSKALAFHTPEPMFLYHAGVIAMAAGHRDEGREFLRQALALNPAFSYPQALDAKRAVEQTEPGPLAPLAAGNGRAVIN